MPVQKVPLGMLDARYVNISGDTMTGALTVTALTVGSLAGYVKATAGLLSAGAIADGDLPATIKGLTLAAQAVGFTIAGGTTSKTLTVALDANVSGTNTGDNAANSSTMYIGTTSHALNRGSAAEGLAGITSLTPATDFTLVQNSVNVLTSVESGGIVNTLVLKAGDVGIGTATPVSRLEISKATASPILTITNLSDTTTYDPQIAFRTGATPATRFTIWLDDSDSDMLKFSPSTATTYPPLILGTTGKSVINLLDNDTEALLIKEATTAYLTFVTTDSGEKITFGKDAETGTIEVDANSGAVDLINMNITGTDAAGTVQSLSTDIDGTKILTVYGEADGAGALQNPRVGINTSTPTAALDVAGGVKLGSASTDTLTMTGRLIVRTLASDPQDATPGNRPAGSVAEIGYYSGKLYFCTNAGTPAWELITSS